MDSKVFTVEYTKPKRQSYSIHFGVKWGIEIHSYCRRKNAIHFTYDWQSVTCTYCLKEREINLKKVIEEIQRRKEHRKWVKEKAKEYSLERQKGEDFYHFANRVDEINLVKLREEQEKDETEEVKRLSITSFLTLIGYEEKLEFPIHRYDIYEDSHDIPKEKYIQLLNELKEWAEDQLEELK